MNLDEARSNMIEQQVRTWDVLDQRVLDALGAVPRETFVAPAHRGIAYSDFALPIGHGQHMLKPMVDGRLLQALELEPTHSVLEIGTGSGYLCACLARLARRVDSLEIVPELANGARARLAGLGIANVTVHERDAAAGSDALPDPDASYDAIALTGSTPEVPAFYRDRVAVGGRLFVIVGDVSQPTMEARLLTRVDVNEWRDESLFETTVAPLSGFAHPHRHFVF